MRQALARWWRQEDHYGWLVDYLHARGLTRPTQILMALVSAPLTFMVVGAIWAPTVHRGVNIVVGVCASVTGIFFAVMWLRHWPTRNQSVAFGITGGAFIAAGILLQSNALGALMGCNGLAVIGGYLAFFHNARFIVVHVIVATVTAAICAARVAADEHYFLAVAGFWLAVEINIAFPLGIQTAIRTLGADVVRSDHDALTGVLNRRAFYERAWLLLQTRRPDIQLVVVMMDLDKFKRLNDTRGHAAGDQALAAVGWAIREAAAPSAIIGRTGGEEFLVIDTLPVADAAALPRRLCSAIAALPHQVTASVGAAIVPLSFYDDPHTVTDALVARADEAMYRAKKLGGNQVGYADPVYDAGSR